MSRQVTPRALRAALKRALFGAGFLCFSACGDDDSRLGGPGSAGTAGTAGSAGTGGGAGTAGSAGGGQDGGLLDGNAPTDFDRMDACPFEPRCAAGGQWVERQSLWGRPAGSACILSALRDRTPGRYSHSIDNTDFSSSRLTRYAFVVRPDGNVVFAGETEGTGAEPPLSAGPAQVCRLAPPAYFESCLATVNDPKNAWDRGPMSLGSPLYDCVYDLSNWVEACTAFEPVCQ
jgi:hypothetical protein